MPLSISMDLHHVSLTGAISASLRPPLYGCTREGAQAPGGLARRAISPQKSAEAAYPADPVGRRGAARRTTARRDSPRPLWDGFG